MATQISKAAVGYIRVSTEDQAAEGVSLDAQREKIAAYCALHGLELHQTFEDAGLSGKRADNRPGLQAALRAVCERRGVLVVYSLSRLARSTRDCILLSERLEKHGADIASITEKLDTTSSMGRFFFTLMSALGQLERDQISERTLGAMDHMRRQGRRISGRVPYGFCLANDGRTLQPDDKERMAIDSMRQARDQGQSLREIAAGLTARGVPARCGGTWYASSVQSVLRAQDCRTSAAS